MPTQGVVDYKKGPHRRNGSDELDVFLAARYYSDNFALTQKVIKEDKQGYLRGHRASLDIATLKHLHQYNNHTIAQPYPQKQQEEQMKDKKHKQHKLKQPSSPGGKLAHFLNTLFNQTSSKKKKPSSKSFSTQSMRDEDEGHKRSSISHFRSSNSAIVSESIYSSSSSEFRTPSCNNLNTTIKCYQDLKSLSDHKQVLANLSNYNIKTENVGSSNYKPRIIEGRGSPNEKSQKGSNLDWVDEKFEFRNGFVENKKKIETIKSFKEEDLDDGGESDSSSDLFELQIDHELGFSSTGLPVYETTRIYGYHQQIS